jgi:hypothetical protein
MKKLCLTLSLKIKVGALLVFGLSPHLFAQSFTLLTDERWLVAQLPGHPIGYQTPASPYADFHGYLNNFNSASDYYVASVDSTLSEGQLTFNSNLNLHGAIPPNGPAASFGAYCAVKFSVSSPVTAAFAFDNFSVSEEGFTYDGLIPTIGITSDDPDFNPTAAAGDSPFNYTIDAFDNTANGSVDLVFSPNHTYTFFEQMTGFGMRSGDTTDLNAVLQANMSLTAVSGQAPVFVPEPSAFILLLLGAGFVGLRGYAAYGRTGIRISAQR